MPDGKTCFTAEIAENAEKIIKRRTAGEVSTFARNKYDKWALGREMRMSFVVLIEMLFSAHSAFSAVKIVYASYSSP